MNNGYNFDYLTVTVKGIELNDFLSLVCESFPADFIAQNFIGCTMGTVTGYNRSYRFMDEKYITISWYEPPTDKTVNYNRETICLRITGQGFKYLLATDVLRLFENLKNAGIEYNVTRIDICYDDYTGVIPKEKFVEEFEAFQLGADNISTTISRESVKFFIGSFQKKSYKNMVVGSRQSKKLLRMYDKKAEQKDKEIEYWQRMEIQLNKQCANEFMEYWLETKNFAQGFTDTLLSMFRIVETSRTRRDRNNTKEWYQEFLDKMNAEKYTFYAELENNQMGLPTIIAKKLQYVKKKIVRTIKDDYESLLLHLFKQYGRAIAFITSHDLTNFNELLRLSKQEMYDNPKYKIFHDNLQFAGA